MNNVYKNLMLWFVIALIMVVLFNFFNTTTATKEKISYTEFIENVESGHVKSVTIKANMIDGEFKDGKNFETVAPNDPELVKILRENKVQIYAKPPEHSPWYVQLLISWLPFLLLIGIWIFFMRQMQGAGGKAFSFGKSRAKLLSHDQQKVTFKDVAGVDEAKEELQEIIEFLKDPQKFQKVGGKIPKGVLLIGPPGTGKTLLAKAVAGEAGVPFFSISGSEFVEMFVGVGAARVRDLFEQGKKHAPCIIFIDEIDAVGRHRGAGLGGGHDEREQTLNQLLVEMDGFESNEGVILISATNRPDVLDPALLRPGRFDRQVVVPRPDVKGRLEILKVHSKKIQMDSDVDLEIIAKGTPGFAGADLANLVNEAALIAARKNKKKATMEDFEEAKDKIMMGKERRSLVITETEKKRIAYHEAGHAIVAKLTPGSDPVHKVSIIPRGLALGITQQLPKDDKYLLTKDYLYGTITVLMGGRIAEEIIFGDISTGAGNDIERATELSRKMVCNWGMSEKLGPLTFGKKEEAIFLGKELATHKDYSEKTAVMIDEEIKSIILMCYKKAKDIIIKNRDTVDKVASLLLEKETIDGNQIDKLLNENNGNLKNDEISNTN
jgi:cell division protease FtsH